MKLHRVVFLAFALLLPAPASAQMAAPAGITRHQISASSSAVPIQSSATLVATSNDMPRWLRWGLIGAVAGAVIWTAADAGNNHTGSVLDHALAGAATGFIIVGGGVALYDAVCDSRRGGC